MGRTISPNEVEVVKWLLHHGLVEVPAHRHPAENLRVVGGCGCGCTTLHFRPLEQQRGTKILADALAAYPDGQQAGLILWGREDEIVMLEVYDFQPGSSHRFPDVSDLCTWEELGRRDLQRENRDQEKA